MAMVYQKGAGKVAVRDEDMHSRQQLEQDGWVAMGHNGESERHLAPGQQPTPPPPDVPFPADTPYTTLPAPNAPTLAPDMWPQDVPANVVALLQQQFGSPGAAAAATDAQLFALGGMTPGYIAAIRKGATPAAAATGTANMPSGNAKPFDDVPDMPIGQ